MAKTNLEPETIQPKPNQSWNIGAIFWGLLLVVFGGLLLLGNLGLVEVDWTDLWRLWPLLIVAAGFSVLATTHWAWKLISVLFVLTAIFAVIWVGTGQYEANPRGLTIQTTSVNAQAGVRQAEVTIKAGASKLTIDSDDTTKVVQARLKSADIRLVEDSRLDGETQKIVLSGSSERKLWFGPQENTWDITLSERLPIKLFLDAGASNITADLADVKMTNLSVKAGASSTVITLGDKVVNLAVDVDSGASTTTLRIPKDSGVALKFNGGLSSRDLDDLDEISNGQYQSRNYSTATKRINIDADAGLASFKIERY